ncbi:MAG: hypothetical protein Q4Q23_07430, partial [Methanobacteriaceae archaeon]|nr:hypothetical protein [Methanobacteriaceae archaeon]
PKNSQEKIDVVEEIIPDHVQKEVKSEEIPEHMKTKDRTKRPTKTTPKRKEKMQRYTSQTIRRDHSNNKPQIRNAPTQNNAELNRKLKRREQELKKRIERKNKRKEEEARKKAPKPKGRR